MASRRRASAGGGKAAWAEMRDFLIERHNRLVAEAFLVHVMSKVTGLIDLGDQDGQLVTTENFVAAVRAGERDFTAKKLAAWMP